MTSNRTLSNLALAMMAPPVILGAALCYLRPGQAWAWAIVMFFSPAAWLLLRAKRMRTEDARRAISGALIFGSLLLSVSLAASLAGVLGLIDGALAHEIAARGASVPAGVFFVLRGNRLPKTLTPLADVRCDPATLQTVQRRTGLAYVLAGFAFAVLWLVLPVRLATPIGIAVILAGILAPTIIMRSYAKGRVGTPSH